MDYKTLLKEIIVEIGKADSIVILRHRKPDPDALGSQLGLRELIKATYPQKAVYVIGDMPDKLKYIGEMDEISLETFHQSLVIVTDCSTPRLINCPFEVNVDEVIKIDHHPNVTPYGKICYVDTTAAIPAMSTSYCINFDTSAKVLEVVDGYKKRPVSPIIPA